MEAGSLAFWAAPEAATWILLAFVQFVHHLLNSSKWGIFLIFGGKRGRRAIRAANGGSVADGLHMGIDLSKLKNVRSNSRASLPAADSFTHETVEFFARVSVALGAQRSIGMIYGLLFAMEEPLSLDDIVERLQISKGSASTGLRFLRTVGAVKSRILIGQRREYFEPELGLRKLVAGFLQQTVEPHLQNAPDSLARLQAAARENASPVARERIKTLERWHKLTSQLIPLVLKFIK